MKVKLGTLGEIFIGLTYKPEDVSDEGTIVLRSSNIQDGKLDFEDIVRVKSNIKDKLMVKDGDILMCSRNGSARLVGKTAIVKDLPEIMTFGAFMTIIRTDNNSYLQYYFKSDYFRCQLRGSTTTTINQITRNMLLYMEVPLLTESESAEIVSNLGRIENIIDMRKQELQRLDELIKARFVEMFGDKNYPLVSLDELSLGKGEYGAQSASVEYNPNRPRYVRITDINDDGSLNDDVVSSANIEDDEQYKLSYGDFMFARMGATVGKAYVYRTGNQIFAGYLIRYKLNLEKIVPEYLYGYTKLKEYQNWVSLNQSGAAQPGINAKKYGLLRIPVAPLEEQKNFVK